MQNTHLNFLYILSLLLTVNTLNAQLITSVSVSPLPARSCNTLTVTVDGFLPCGNTIIDGTDYNIVGNTVFVYVYLTQPVICLPVIIPYSRPQSIGMLTEGAYTLTVQVFENFVPVTSLSSPLTVSSCCLESNILDQSTIPNGTYQASNLITASGIITTGSSVVFKAGNQIQLLPGFAAEDGSNFSAIIANCADAVAVSQVSMPVQENLLQNSDLRIYPNPSDGRFVLEIPETQIEAIRSIALFDLSGKPIRRILTQDLYTNKVKIDLSRQARGMYLLKVQSAHGVMVKRILLQ